VYINKFIVGDKVKYAITQVKRYSRELTRTLKNGKKKKYTTIQYVLTIPERDSPFNDKEEVIVIPIKYKEDILNLNSNKIEFEINYKELKENNKELLVTVKDQVNTITNINTEMNRLRNKHDHLQERLRTALEEINLQQKIVTDLSNRSFTDYLFGRKPKSLKLIEGEKS
jgi:FtsZ-binding cell division protein ZapB